MSKLFSLAKMFEEKLSNDSDIEEIKAIMKQESASIARLLELSDRVLTKMADDSLSGEDTKYDFAQEVFAFAKRYVNLMRKF